MPAAKVMSWNIEHMHDWFADTEERVVPDFEPIATKVANVLQDIAPQILCVQEGPTRKQQMESFLEEFVGPGWTVIRGETGASQKPYIAFQDFGDLQGFDEIDFNAEDWRYSFLKHSEESGRYNMATEKFTRLPVEVLFETGKGTFSVMCLHLKSKISFVSKNALSSDPAKRTLGIAEGLEQRARILQEATLLRDYLQSYPFVDSVKGRHIVVGDLNDGPGRDFFERRFFSTDLMRRIRGDIDHVDEILIDLLERVSEAKRFTAVFFDQLDKELRHLLLDHILVAPRFLKSSGLRVLKSTARIEHEAYEQENAGDWSKKKKPGRGLYPSDHRPVTVTVKW